MIPPVPPAPPAPPVSSRRTLLRAGVGLLALEAAFGALILLAAHPDIPVRPVVRIALAPTSPPLPLAARPTPRFAEFKPRKPALVRISLPEPGLSDGRRVPVLRHADLLFRDRLPGAELAEGYGFPPDADQVLPGDPVPSQDPLLAEDAVPSLSTVAELSQLFASLDYKLVKGADVPSLFLDRLPIDLADEPESRRRKALFLGALLPLIVQANERNLALRAEVDRVDAALAAGADDSETEGREAALLAEFRLDSWDRVELMRRADVVPPSLALAQAAAESGWGRSIFARDNNSLFGQREFARTEQSEGRLVPRLRRFDDLAAAVNAYVRNLNTHRAYADFRRARAALRTGGRAPSGPQLVGYLTRYSEQGSEYIQRIRSLMQSNDLTAFDRTRLRRASVEIADPPAKPAANIN